MPARPERTALYRFFDANDGLLYIGISHEPDVRWESHRASRQWPSLVANRTIQWFDTQQAAAAAEVIAIRTEKPQFNLAHNFEMAPFPCSQWPRLADIKRGKADRLADLIREEIDSGRWRPGHKLPRREAMAEATGVSLTTAITATAALERQGFIILRRGLGLFVRRRGAPKSHNPALS